MDSIYLSNISVWTHIGVPDGERRIAQHILVSVELFCPLKNVSQRDDISVGIDYAKVTEAIQALAKTERKTIERFAEDIAAHLLMRCRPQGGVKVTVMKKPDLPLESASVTIARP